MEAAIAGQMIRDVPLMDLSGYKLTSTGWRADPVPGAPRPAAAPSSVLVVGPAGEYLRPTWRVSSMIFAGRPWPER